MKLTILHGEGKANIKLVNVENIPDIGKGCMVKNGSFLEDSEGFKYIGNAQQYMTPKEDHWDLRVLRSAVIILKDGEEDNLVLEREPGIFMARNQASACSIKGEDILHFLLLFIRRFKSGIVLLNTSIAPNEQEEEMGAVEKGDDDGTERKFLKQIAKKIGHAIESKTEMKTQLNLLSSKSSIGEGDDFFKIFLSLLQLLEV